jgi:hypothetical protein
MDGALSLPSNCDYAAFTSVDGCSGIGAGVASEAAVAFFDFRGLPSLVKPAVKPEI